MPPPQVRYTEARDHQLRRMLVFPGTVEAQTSSTLASTVAGLVVEFPAKEGMRVTRGQVLARLRSTPTELTLEAQRAALREAQARWKLAESTLARIKQLSSEGVASQQQLDDAQSEYNAWMGRSDALRADIARLEDEIDRMSVRAPLAGIVIRERTEVGQWMTIGGPVVDLLAIDQMEVRLEVPERYFADLRVGASTEVTFESLAGFRVTGKIIAIIPQADPQARTFPVKVQVSNERGRIGAGMLAQVSFTAGEPYHATIVPKDAVVARGERRVLYRINGTNKVEEVPVETGAGAGMWIEVRGTVKPGDKVITRGNERILPGMDVAAQPLAYQKPGN
jgi:RND family efflux transporter MFP subunit